MYPPLWHPGAHVWKELESYLLFSCCYSCPGPLVRGWKKIQQGSCVCLIMLFRAAWHGRRLALWRQAKWVIYTRIRRICIYTIWKFLPEINYVFLSVNIPYRRRCGKRCTMTSEPSKITWAIRNGMKPLSLCYHASKSSQSHLLLVFSSFRAAASKCCNNYIWLDMKQSSSRPVINRKTKCLFWTRFLFHSQA